MAEATSVYPRPTEDELATLRSDTKANGHITLQKVDLRHLESDLRKIRSLNLNECDLRGVTLVNARRSPVCWSEVKLVRCHMDGFVLGGVRLRMANFLLRESDIANAETLTFSHCKLVGARINFGNSQPWVRFISCDLHKAKLSSGGPGPRLRFSRTKGLWGVTGAILGSLPNQEIIEFNLVDFPTWERLRSIGATRLMSVSWLAVIGLVVYANAIRWYNDQIESVHKNVTDGSTADSWVDQLGPIPTPTQFGWLMLSIASIAVAATILHWRCPPLVLHHTRHQWNLLSQKYDLEYQGASYDRWWWRWACALGYAGGIYAAVYLAVRVLNSVVFFFGWLGDEV